MLQDRLKLLTIFVQLILDLNVIDGCLLDITILSIALFIETKKLKKSLRQAVGRGRFRMGSTPL